MYWVWCVGKKKSVLAYSKSTELEHVPPSPRFHSMLPLVLRSCPHFTLDEPYSLFFNSVIPAYSNVPSVVNVIAADCLADCPLTYRQDMFGSWIVGASCAGRLCTPLSPTSNRLSTTSVPCHHLVTRLRNGCSTQKWLWLRNAEFDYHF